MPVATYKRLVDISPDSLVTEVMSMYASVTSKDLNFKTPQAGITFFNDLRPVSFKFVKRHSAIRFVQSLIDKLDKAKAKLEALKIGEELAFNQRVVKNAEYNLDLYLYVKGKEEILNFNRKLNSGEVLVNFYVSTAEFYDMNFYARRIKLVAKITAMMDALNYFLIHLRTRPVNG